MDSWEDEVVNFSTLQVRLTKIISKVNMDGLPIKCSILLKEVNTSKGAAINLFIKGEVIDIHDKCPTIVLGFIHHYDNAKVKEDVVYDHIRSALHRLMAHEVDEQLLIDGQRMYDPHSEFDKESLND